MKILVTGVTGFIGQSLVDRLAVNQDYCIWGTARRAGVKAPKRVSVIPVGDVCSSTNWSRALQDVGVVVHLAARAHVLGDSSLDPLAEFRSINVEGALTLARQALDAGVKRFIFISSIGVNGSYTSDKPFNESSIPAPHADYAISKLEAEQGLRVLLKGSDMELVIIRPPLVYAGHAPGNFARLLKLVACRVPLPFSAVRNTRSMIALENLVEFITLCIEHPAAANELFLVSDGVDVSTTDIICYLAAGMSLKAHLLPVPNFLIRYGASLLGKQAVYTQLCGSLAIDSSKARDLLGWSPQVTPEQALFKAGQDYQQIVALRS